MATTQRTTLTNTTSATPVQAPRVRITRVDKATRRHRISKIQDSNTASTAPAQPPRIRIERVSKPGRWIRFRKVDGACEPSTASTAPATQSAPQVRIERVNRPGRWIRFKKVTEQASELPAGTSAPVNAPTPALVQRHLEHRGTEAIHQQSLQPQMDVDIPSLIFGLCIGDALAIDGESAVQGIINEQAALGLVEEFSVMAVVAGILVEEEKEMRVHPRAC